MQDLEEDPTLRSQINLYKDEAALQAQVRYGADLGEIQGRSRGHLGEI